MSFEKLKPIRLTDPSQFALIPRYLFDQIKNAETATERIYQLVPTALKSPFMYFYALADKDTNLIKGMVWFEYNVMTDKLTVQSLSVDREYQHNGVLDGVYELAREVQKITKAKAITTTTKRPKAYMRKHPEWKLTGRVFMEME